MDIYDVSEISWSLVIQAQDQSQTTGKRVHERLPNCALVQFVDFDRGLLGYGRATYTPSDDVIVVVDVKGQVLSLRGRRVRSGSRVLAVYIREEDILLDVTGMLSHKELAYKDLMFAAKIEMALGARGVHI